VHVHGGGSTGVIMGVDVVCGMMACGRWTAATLLSFERNVFLTLYHFGTNGELPLINNPYI